VTLTSLSTAHTGDVGGQRTLRPYWRNYFEQTDAVVWVVDSGDRFRLEDCKRELEVLLVEEVRTILSHLPRQRANQHCLCGSLIALQRLAGATLLIFANKQDVAGALSVAEIRDVRLF
jgi:ADP-ribosylation factor-like protein 2